MKNIKGAPGLNGEGKNKNGSYAENKIIKVPVGTTVKDFDTNLVIADLTKHNEEVVVAYGGKGGRGNVTLATRSNPCPSSGDTRIWWDAGSSFCWKDSAGADCGY